MNTRRTTDFLIIGGGVIGLALALEARRRFGDARILLIEKERACGLHASGRNSGVLHAGFYYSADSLKARFAREGNQRLTRYGEERGLRINRCGKLVVARDETELAGIDELLRRSRLNGVDLQEVTEHEARELEPLARTFERALFSPNTSTVDPTEVVSAMVADARTERVDIRENVRYLRRRGDLIRTSAGDISAGYVINAAGLYADRIARDFGFAQDYRILPFKGLYLYAEGSLPLRCHIYPVPDLRHPFLGVHFTLTVDGHVKIGPTAIPAFWREQYSGVDNFHPGEFAEVVGLEAAVFLENAFDFRRLALHELRKYSRRHLVRLAGGLVRSDLTSLGWRWGRAGIRAQLVNVRRRTLEMDFHLQGDGRSMHVLNAVSPGFTCSLPFASYVIDEVQRHLVARPAPPQADRPVTSLSAQGAA